MSVLRYGPGAALLALLAACSSNQPEWKPVEAPATTAWGAAIPAAQLTEFQQQLSHDLKDLVTRTQSSGLRFVVRVDGEPALYLDDTAFHGDSGELSATALSPLSQLAMRVTQSCPCVVHVIGEQVGDSTLPSSDIGERRAAAVAAVLVRFGVLPARLRYESRLVAGRAAGVDIVVSTLVEGSEPMAWVPPAISVDSP